MGVLFLPESSQEQESLVPSWNAMKLQENFIQAQIWDLTELSKSASCVPDVDLWYILSNFVIYSVKFESPTSNIFIC